MLTVLNIVNICEWLIYIFYPAKTRNFIRTNLVRELSKNHIGEETAGGRERAP